jgi:hypothetical protein
MIKLTAYFFIFILSLSAYVHDGWGLFDETPIGTSIVASDYEFTFNEQVGVWAEELTEVTDNPIDTDGNCLPVAVELQRRIVETGRSALIVAINTDDPLNDHALVLYTSKLGGRFDYVIDNGYSTAWVAQPRVLLDEGLLGGEYYATCMEPKAENGTCKRFGLPF